MNYSARGLELTKHFESCKLVSYKDQCKSLRVRDHVCTEQCPGVWTDGWGNTKNVVAGRRIAQEKADADLSRNISVAVGIVNHFVKVPLTQNQFDALVDLQFNCGAIGKGEKECTLLRLLNAGDREGAAMEFPKWNKAGGKVLAGLVVRRKAEQQLFKTPTVQ